MTTGAGTVESDASTERPALWRRSIDSPPGPWFHAILAVPTLVLLWSHTVPGAEFEPWVLSAAALLVLAVAWSVRVVVFVVGKRRWSWWLAVAPVCGVVVLGLLAVDAPLHARWAVAEPAFVDVYESMRAAPATGESASRVDQSDPAVPDEIGTYDVLGGIRVQDGAVFFLDSSCFMFCSAGFAFVADGTVQDVFDDGLGGAPTTITPLGDGWYAWVSD